MYIVWLNKWGLEKSITKSLIKLNEFKCYKTNKSNKTWNTFKFTWISTNRIFKTVIKLRNQKCRSVT